jgi:hypothetical protein
VRSCQIRRSGPRQVFAKIADAEQAARSITDPNMQAEALAGAASAAEPARARTWIASALAGGHWTIPLKALARIDPAAFVDEWTGLSGAL